MQVDNDTFHPRHTINGSFGKFVKATAMKNSDNAEVISIGSTDSSSDEDDVKIVSHCKKVARRGLNLASLCTTNLESEKDFPSSAIYSSKILKFKEQQEAMEQCLSSMKPIELTEDDNSCDTSVTEEMKEGGTMYIQEGNIKNMNSDPNSFEKNKRRNSPSPPPPIQPVARKPTRKTMKLLGNIERNKVLYAASKQLFSPERPLLAENDLLDTESTRIMPAKFRWQGSVFRVPMKRNEKFLSVLPVIAERCQVHISDILLERNEETIQAEDSPLSVGLSSADIIDCYVLSSSTSHDKNVITLLIQASDCKKKVSISVNQFSPLSEMMEEYAKQRSLPLSKMKFKFDGDNLDPTDTPHDLGMENENCIDVVVLR